MGVFYNLILISCFQTKTYKVGVRNFELFQSLALKKFVFSFKITTNYAKNYKAQPSYFGP